MEVTVLIKNNTPFAVIAFGWNVLNEDDPAGPDILISPGETVEVTGPHRVGEELLGSICCQEESDSIQGFQVLPGLPLRVGRNYRGVVVRHYLDARIPIDQLLLPRKEREAEEMN